MNDNLSHSQRTGIDNLYIHKVLCMEKLLFEKRNFVVKWINVSMNKRKRNSWHTFWQM